MRAALHGLSAFSGVSILRGGRPKSHPRRQLQTGGLLSEVSDIRPGPVCSELLKSPEYLEVPTSGSGQVLRFEPPAPVHSQSVSNLEQTETQASCLDIQSLEMEARHDGLRPGDHDGKLLPMRRSNGNSQYRAADMPRLLERLGREPQTHLE